jgi:transposase-like protein
MNLISVFQRFPNQETCITHLEKTRWKGVATCPYCKSQKSHKNKGENRHYCHTCKTSYCVTVGTIFHNTKLPLQKWFLAIAIILNAKKGISSRQLARDLEVTKDTAWRMQMQIRKAMIETPSLMTGVVEMDETYIGARKPRKSSNDKDEDGNYPKNPRGRGTKNKTPVVGAIQRGGKVFAKMQSALKFADLKKTAKELIDFDKAVLITDDYRGYTPFKNFIEHHTVNHSAKEYARGQSHTNTIEGFWSLLKRGIVGQYHHLSDKHLNKYIVEFCFKYNNKDNDNVFENLLVNAVSF